MREEDWIELQQAIEQQSGAEQPPQEGQPGGQNDIATASPEQLQQVLAKLPPEIKQQVKSAISSGVSPKHCNLQCNRHSKVPLRHNKGM